LVKVPQWYAFEPSVAIPYVRDYKKQMPVTNTLPVAMFLKLRAMKNTQARDEKNNLNFYPDIVLYIILVCRHSVQHKDESNKPA
jgi:hypothetical protein